MPPHFHPPTIKTAERAGGLLRPAGSIKPESCSNLFGSEPWRWGLRTRQGPLEHVLSCCGASLPGPCLCVPGSLQA